MAMVVGAELINTNPGHLIGVRWPYGWGLLAVWLFGIVLFIPYPGLQTQWPDSIIRWVAHLQFKQIKLPWQSEQVSQDLEDGHTTQLPLKFS